MPVTNTSKANDSLFDPLIFLKLWYDPHDDDD